VYDYELRQSVRFLEIPNDKRGQFPRKLLCMRLFVRCGQFDSIVWKLFAPRRKFYNEPEAIVEIKCPATRATRNL